MCNHETSRRGVFTAVVVANDKLCDEHFLIRLALSPARNAGRGFPPSQAGQFVQVQCQPTVQPPPAGPVEWTADQQLRVSQPELKQTQALLRRPLSLAARAETTNGTELSLIYRVIGAGTGWLAGTEAGQAVSIIGPLGNALPISPDKPQAVLVGGGVGIPPMLYAAEMLGRAGRQTVAFCGARSLSLLPLRINPENEKQLRLGLPSQCCREFAERGARVAIASDDGSVGYPGLVTEPLAKWLDAGDILADDLVVYSCGPEAMMRAVGEICISRNVECYLSLERHMACGMGTCQSCVVKIRDETDQGWSYKLCCTDGPVFRAEDIVWE